MALPSAAKRDAAEAWLAAHPRDGATWIGTARKAAAARLRGMGMPVRRDEYWRYSNPARLTDLDPPAGIATADDSAFAARDRLRLVFSGGRLDRSASDEAVEIASLAEAARADIHWAKDLFGVLEAQGQAPVGRPLAALNTAIAEAGALIRIDGRAKRPIELVYQSESDNSEAFFHHVIRLDAGAEMTLLETGTAAARSNVVVEVDLAEGAVFHHLRTQGPDKRLTAAHLFVRLGPNARFKSFTLSAGGSLTRNEAVIDLAGDNASAHVAGVAMAGAGAHHDDTVFVTHDAVACESRQVFKRVLRAGSTGVFQGKILVKAGAQKTDGYQIGQTLLLDDDAVVLTKPELEIYADDVQCSHGSTTGAIDETALYYLRSRGVPKDQAQALLVRAFLASALDEIDDADLAADMAARLDLWLE